MSTVKKTDGITSAKVFLQFLMMRWKMKKAVVTKISGKLSLILAGSNFITCAEAKVTTVVNKDGGSTFFQETVGVLMLRINQSINQSINILLFAGKNNTHNENETLK